MARNAGRGFDGKDMLCPDRLIVAQTIVNGRLILADQTRKGGLATECPAGPCEGRIKFILNCHTPSMGIPIRESMGKTI